MKDDAAALYHNGSCMSQADWLHDGKWTTATFEAGEVPIKNGDSLTVMYRPHRNLLVHLLRAFAHFILRKT